VLTKAVSAALLAGNVTLGAPGTDAAHGAGGHAILGGRLSVIRNAMNAMPAVGRGAVTVPQHFASGGIAGAMFAASGSGFPEISGPMTPSPQGSQRGVTTAQSPLDRYTAARAEVQVRGGDITVNIDAVDGPSVLRVFKQNAREVRQGLDYMAARGR
jgi:hypothetical protein